VPVLADTGARIIQNDFKHWRRVCHLQQLDAAGQIFLRGGTRTSYEDHAIGQPRQRTRIRKRQNGRGIYNYMVKHMPRGAQDIGGFCRVEQLSWLNGWIIAGGKHDK
jgi:hypothetical protein